MPNPTNYLDFATTLAKEAGVMIKNNFGLNTHTEWKADQSPLTLTDTAVNELVIARVKEQFPQHSILGEENSFWVENSPLTWVCDPIDGTSPFSIGMPISTFSLALVENGKPILGVIYDPFSDRLFTAEKDKGAFLNAEPIHVSTRATFEKTYIACESRNYIPLILPLIEQNAKVLRLYCGTCPGILTACGKFDAVLYDGKGSWDFAALKIIVEEAGGKVTDKDGNEQRYDQPLNGAIASNGLLHEKLLKMVRELAN